MSAGTEQTALKAAAPVEKPADDRIAQQQAASQSTRRELDALVVAMQKLEAALASPAPAREQKWARRANHELAEVTAALQLHVASAERPGGLLDELNLANAGVHQRVDHLRRDHAELLESARRLEQSLTTGDQPPDFQSLRRQASLLLNSLREDHSQEVDLIFECFWTDLGVGD